MKTDFVGGVVVFFVLLFLYTKFIGGIPFTVTSVTTTKTDSFTVTGTGKVEAPPDLAIVNAGVQTQGPTVKAAQDALNAKINAVASAIKRAGVDAKDIQTSNYTVSPAYNYQDSPPLITGYQANSNLTIKVRAMDKANTVIDAATQAGATQVGGINFTVEDKTKPEDEARTQAVAEAKRKAEDAARIAGFHLGKIINYSENFNGIPGPLPMISRVDAGGVGAPTQVEPGTNEITVTVSLSYEVK